VLLSVVERRQHWAAQWTYLQTWLLSGSGSREDLLAGYLHSSVFSDEVLGVASRDFHGICKTSGIARRSYLSVTYESRWPSGSAGTTMPSHPSPVTCATCSTGSPSPCRDLT